VNLPTLNLFLPICDDLRYLRETPL